ncbi:hypothetical protein H6F93_01715 [Leptolyngbya sp. FACHB-671]|uniref:hypothetical protein n=1 Tax=Leptolyngbya sp. FACHB-671 TaxID=2692812 RepID=UPI00168260E4|nr:hypothetical protein [Leptolyngbya sp. FACHB-671]MBD2066256.1 hypothetical protein [Leptolyngbya sp. FACHB-671]
MYKISGKVLVKETGAGIADLQVVIYDVDNQEQFNSGKEPGEFFSNSKSPEPKLFWQAFPGDRLGSVLTDEKGKFELTFDAEDFQAREQVKRPDLVLYVIAPEDTQINEKGEVVPYPDLTQKRVLHTSYDIVVNSGKTEEYIIRLSKPLLDRFSLVYQDQNQTNSQPSQLIDSLEETRQLETALLQHERKYVQSNVEQERKRAESAKKFIANFTAIPSQFRQNPLFIGEAKARNAAPKQMAALIEARNLGLKHLKAYKERFNPQLQVYLTDRKLADLQRRGILRLDGNNYFIDSVCSLLSSNISGVALQRVRELFERKIEEPDIPTENENNSTITNGDSTSTDTELSPAEQIRQRVLGQIQHLETPSLAKNSKGVMNNLLEMLQELKAQAQGPADVAALKDFHSLQIAFPHVWAEAFNKKLRKDVETLYHERMKLHEDYGVSLPPLEAINEVNELRDFLNQTREDLSYMATSPVPLDVASTFPEVDISTWNSLSTAQQRRLKQLASEAITPEKITELLQSTILFVRFFWSAC